MKTIKHSQTIALTRPLGREYMWVFGILFGILLLCVPYLSHGQDTYPQTANPHADMSEPPLPEKGVVGIAIYVTADRIGDPAGLFIRATHPNGPAAKAGLMHGQEILAVDGTLLAGKTYREVIEMIRGKVGQQVTLRVKTFNDVKEVTLTRVGEDQLVSEQHT